LSIICACAVNPDSRIAIPVKPMTFPSNFMI
jgi:hypothetical protein